MDDDYTNMIHFSDSAVERFSVNTYKIIIIQIIVRKELSKIF